MVFGSHGDDGGSAFESSIIVAFGVPESADDIVGAVSLTSGTSGDGSVSIVAWLALVDAVALFAEEDRSSVRADEAVAVPDADADWDEYEKDDANDAA